jgi:DNA polymerase III subunit alpha
MLLIRSFSHYSLLSAVPKIPDLITNASSKGYTTMCLTDDETGAGFVDQYESLKKLEKHGTVGTTLKTPNSSKIITSAGSSKNYSKIALIAKNNIGYKQLCKLVSIALVERENPNHILKQDLLDQYDSSTYLVICSNDHEFVQAIREENMLEAKSILKYYTSIYKPEDIIVEAINPLNDDDKDQIKKWNLTIEKLCKEFKVHMIVSPAPRYLDQDQEEIFKIVLAIRDNAKVWDINLQRPFHLPSIDELKKDFGYLEDKVWDTQAIEDTIKLEIRTDYDKHANEAFFPYFPLNEGEDYNGRLIYEVYIGLLTRFILPEGLSFSNPETIRDYWYAQYPYSETAKIKEFITTLKPDTTALLGYPKDFWETKSMNDYLLRIDLELDVICSKGYPSYFLVLADLMRFCRLNDIVTTTRGSAAGCIIGYLTGINTIDPLIYDIPFERFLNPMRPSAPDIDGDFADDKREMVIQYLTDTYGKENVTQIITFGTMKPRAAVRDVGRALGISYTKCDKLSKLIPTPPQGKPATFKWAMETSEELKTAYESDEEVARIVNLAKIVEGNYRHASVHAAGVVITPTPASDYAPLQWDSDHKFVISQYNMNVGEKIGHVKIDILGIRNLAILGNSITLAETRHGVKINLQNIDMHDKKAFELLSKGRTMGLFQLSGPAMTRYLVEMEPNRVQDLMAMVALYRPGPMANIPDYIKRKKNPKLIKYITPEMEGWMKDSYGILVYQDDLLYSVLNLAGYDWAEADTFRKGVGKKIQSVLDSQHVRFVDGCVTKGMDKDKAEEIWDLFVPFAAYGFNKAHASSYGMVAYWTAYMKGEYTVEFMTALMSSESNKLDKIAEAINECKELGIAVLPPDVNSSYFDFNIENEITIRYGLNSVKMLGVDVIKHLITSRKDEGKFSDLQDFLRRMAKFQGFNKRSLEALIWSGALDTLGNGSIKN